MFMEDEQAISPDIKKLTARVSREIHRRVRDEATRRDVNVDRVIEEAVLLYFARGVGEKTVSDIPPKAGTSKNTGATDIILPVPETLAENLALLQRDAPGIFYALESITAACAASVTGRGENPGVNDSTDITRQKVQQVPRPRKSPRDRSA